MNLKNVLVYIFFIMNVVVYISLLSVFCFILIGERITAIWLSMVGFSLLLICASAFLPAHESPNHKGYTRKPNQYPFEHFAPNHIINICLGKLSRISQFKIGIKRILGTKDIPNEHYCTYYHPFHMFRRIIRRQSTKCK
jgi:hypothetical protein